MAGEEETSAIVVDLDRCEGHGRCYAVAPQLLRPLDDYGHAEYFGPPSGEFDADLVALAQRAVSSCPEEALSWRVAD